MKKFLIALMVMILSACTLGTATTPKQKVSEFLDKYKNEHTNVMEQLKDTIESEFTNDDYKKRYTILMTNQYKNMEYEIKDEIVEDTTAVVEVEVTVLNYGAAITNANTYLEEHSDEFKKASSTIASDNAKTTTTDENNTITTSDVDNDKFTEYKLSQMEKVNDTVKYTIEFNLTKNDNDEWEIDSLSDTDLEKLHGIYTE